MVIKMILDIHKIKKICCYPCEMCNYTDLEDNKIPCCMENDYRTCSICGETAEKIINYIMESEKNMINVIFRDCEFENDKGETIRYVETRLVYGDQEIIVRPINEKNKKRLNNALKKEGFKIGKIKKGE